MGVSRRNTFLKELVCVAGIQGALGQAKGTEELEESDLKIL